MLLKIYLLLYCISPLQAARSQKNVIPAILQQVEKHYRRSSTLSADFSQIVFEEPIQQKKTSSGKIWIQRPSYMRWETLEPNPSLLIYQKQHSWFYTPPFSAEDRGQWIEKSISPAQSQLAQALLSASFSNGIKTMTIQRISSKIFRLIPAKKSAGSIQEATITINPTQNLIEQIVLKHEGGNRTEINLSHITLGKPINKNLFIFSPPTNADQITDEALEN